MYSFHTNIDEFECKGLSQVELKLIKDNFKRSRIGGYKFHCSTQHIDDNTRDQLLEVYRNHYIIELDGQGFWISNTYIEELLKTI